jgi:hypothetical protein
VEVGRIEGKREKENMDRVYGFSSMVEQGLSTFKALGSIPKKRKNG